MFCFDSFPLVRGIRVDVEIAEIATPQLGLITRRQLIELGLSEQAVDYRLAKGRLRVVHPAVYSIPGLPDMWEREVLAATLAAHGSAVSHLAAGKFWGLDGVGADRPHLLVAHDRRIHLQGVTVHRSRTLERGDIARRKGLLVTSPTRTLVDLASMLCVDELESALDDALRRRIVTVQRLRSRTERIHGRVKGLGSLRRLLRDRRLGAPSGSPAETRFRRRVKKSRLTMPVAQYEVRDESGRMVARVDFAYPEQRIAIEIDGWAYHSGRKRRASDIARQNRLTLAGWTFLRFDAEDAARSPRVLDQIATVLGSPTQRDRG